MSRVHDMGGRFGDGAIDPTEPDEVFPQDWHGRALALTLAAGGLGQWNLDISRHARECLSPQDYARFGYYEKWIAGLTDLLVDNGVVTQEELSTLIPASNSRLQDRKMLPNMSPRYWPVADPLTVHRISLRCSLSDNG